MVDFIEIRETLKSISLMANNLTRHLEESSLSGQPSELINLSEQREREMYLKKVLTRLYNLLPLDDVLTDYYGEILRQGDEILFESTRGNRVKLIIDKNHFFCAKNVGDVEKTASTAAKAILSYHKAKWIAFAAQAFYRSVVDQDDCFHMVYGVLEDRRGFDRRGETIVK